MFAERVVAALFGPLFTVLKRDILRRIDDMDAALQTAIENLSTKVDEATTGLANEAGEIKTNLQSVAQAIRDGLSSTEAVARLNSIADRVGALGTGINALSDVVTLDNTEPAPPST